MQNNLQELANIIGRVYRGYDQFPDIKVDEDIYLSDRHKCFNTMAQEYAEVLSRGTVVDQDAERPKSLLRGMLRHVSEQHTNEVVVYLHWLKAKDEWIEMDSTIKSMMV